MFRNIRIAPSLVLVALPIALAACAGGVPLKPASAIGPDASGDSRVVDTVAGVHMSVATGQWNGDASVIDHVTPMHVHIENDSDHPLRVSYDNFALVATTTGTRYSALPPIDIDGSVTRQQHVVSNPGFAANGFDVAPYYQSSYPGMTPYGSAYGYDSGYYNTYASRWRGYQVRLPTPHMRDVAVPDGVLEPGGSVDGFMYFEHVPAARVAGVDFQATLVDVDSGERFGQIRIPFISTQ